MTSPEDLSHLIDRCAFEAVKAALLNSPDVEYVAFVTSRELLEKVAAHFVDGDTAAVDGLRSEGKIVFISPVSHDRRTQVNNSSYLLDTDYVHVILLPPFYLVHGNPHSQPLEQAVAVQGVTWCKECGHPCGTLLTSGYWMPPWNYSEGVGDRCLGCWLGNEPEQVSPQDRLVIEPTGDLLADYSRAFGLGYHLAIMPVARLQVEFRPLGFPGMVCFYPSGEIDLESLQIAPFDEHSRSLTEHLNKMSGITAETFESHTLVVMPCRFEWDDVRAAGHKAQLEFIRSLSEAVDEACLNVIRYCQCGIDNAHTLPGRAGQIDTNYMMAGAILYSDEEGGRIIGGDPFSHIVTKGLGLPLEAVEADRFPWHGETGRLACHALSMYSHLIESNSSTSKFVQCLTLLEFLASIESLGQFKSFGDRKRHLVRMALSSGRSFCWAAVYSPQSWLRRVARGSCMSL